MSSAWRKLVNQIYVFSFSSRDHNPRCPTTRVIPCIPRALATSQCAVLLTRVVGLEARAAPYAYALKR
jgi:hypothetical protein